jgi:hypothetical protein
MTHFLYIDISNCRVGWGEWPTSTNRKFSESKNCFLKIGMLQNSPKIMNETKQEIFKSVVEE